MVNEIFWFDNSMPGTLDDVEFFKLLNMMHNGDEEAKKKLIEHNIRLVVSVINRNFKNVEYDKNDLFSYGIIGLINALNTYDIKRKVSFSTYATKCIYNEILRFLYYLNNCSVEESINKKIVFESGNEMSLEDFLFDEHSFEEDYLKKELYEFLRIAINELSEKERVIIFMHYGFYENKVYTMKEVGQIMNLSQTQIRHLISRILEKLRKNLVKNDVITLKRNI